MPTRVLNYRRGKNRKLTSPTETSSTHTSTTLATAWRIPSLTATILGSSLAARVFSIIFNSSRSNSSEKRSSFKSTISRSGASRRECKEGEESSVRVSPLTTPPSVSRWSIVRERASSGSYQDTMSQYNRPSPTYDVINASQRLR